ncbi:hypothetical protein FSP39_016489 [Pinctada imbricata]|uniref:PH domain-containing protein n=1 Tax=Pinctada imbricata TaxID=66713 RepID=A0AA88YFE0_PINIB|nr:hypothetical protein FSP39_016489 [Pinctada imbricata]
MTSVFPYDDFRSAFADDYHHSTFTNDYFRFTSFDDDFRSTSADDDFRFSFADDDFSSAFADNHFPSVFADNDYSFFCFDVSSSRTGAGSTGGSSRGSSSSGHHSDLINQLADNGDVKQFLSSELSDDDAESDDSIHTMTEAESHVSYKQFGAIRKAGWLVVKNWLIHRKRKLELAPKRKWKHYWVCLKGTVLLFFEGGEESVISESSIPRHILVIEGGIAQAVPEHPKRENIFSLSTAFGDAYLFQAASATELENWISVIHSALCFIVRTTTWQG